MGDRFSRRHRRHRFLPLLEALEGRWVLDGGGANVGTTTDTTTPADQPLQVPVLNSYPAAKAQLYLDFQGHQLASWGGFSNINIPAFSAPGNIEAIWQRVAEDFAPFNLNVTTVEPASWDDALDLRVVVGGDGAWTDGVNSGLSQVGSFAGSDPNVVFVFPDNLGQGDPKMVADAISHEAGHAFGLDHQSVWDENGNLVDEYNHGDLGRAPIMGDSYAAQRSLWWLGPTDESPDDIQDDMAIIGGAANGFGWRPDDVGDSPGAAKPLAVANQFVHGAGIIGTMDDLDYWWFNTDAGTVILQVTVPAGIANLDAKLELVDASGNVIVPWQDPADSLDATVVATVDAGSYRVVVGSHGLYGDVGQYTIDGSVAPPTGDLQAPIDLVASAVSSTAISLSWNDQAESESGFVLERTLDGVTWSPIANVPANTTQYADTGLTPGMLYTYRVQALTDLGPSNYSLPASATTPLDVPAAPTNLEAVGVTFNQINLTWTDNADNETGYVVERSSDGSFWLTIAVLPANSTSYQDIGLPANTKFLYRVHALNGAAPWGGPPNSIGSSGLPGNGSTSDASNIASASTLPPTPIAPTNLLATTIAFNEVDLVWVDNADNETGYVVQYSIDGVTWIPIAALPANATSFQDLGLSGATAYQYQVYAVNGVVSSSMSNSVVMTTPPEVPSAPSGLQAIAVAYNQVYLAWKDNADNETGYVVERSADGGGHWSSIAKLAPDVGTYQDVGLSASTTYTYRVHAVSGNVSSLLSNSARAVTLVAPPTAPIALKLTAKGSVVYLSWASASNNETQFIVYRSLNGKTWTPIAVTAPQLKSLKVAKPPVGKTYYFAVVAVNPSGVSAFSRSVALRFRMVLSHAAM
jgi:Fibronectin type III domain